MNRFLSLAVVVVTAACSLRQPAEQTQLTAALRALRGVEAVTTTNGNLATLDDAIRNAEVELSMLGDRNLSTADAGVVGGLRQAQAIYKDSAILMREIVKLEHFPDIPFEADGRAVRPEIARLVERNKLPIEIRRTDPPLATTYRSTPNSSVKTLWAMAATLLAESSRKVNVNPR